MKQNLRRRRGGKSRSSRVRSSRSPGPSASFAGFCFTNERSRPEPRASQSHHSRVAAKATEGFKQKKTPRPLRFAFPLPEGLSLLHDAATFPTRFVFGDRKSLFQAAPGELPKIERLANFVHRFPLPVQRREIRVFSACVGYCSQYFKQSGRSAVANEKLVANDGKNKRVVLRSPVLETRRRTSRRLESWTDLFVKRQQPILKVVAFLHRVKCLTCLCVRWSVKLNVRFDYSIARLDLRPRDRHPAESNFVVLGLVHIGRDPVIQIGARVCGENRCQPCDKIKCSVKSELALGIRKRCARAHGKSSTTTRGCSAYVLEAGIEIELRIRYSSFEISVVPLLKSD